jgi:hypothetical protein
MASSMLSSRLQSAVFEYGVFYQLWPKFEGSNGERRLIGAEVELIGSHTADPNHLDLACPMCHHVRSALLTVANDLVQQTGLASPDFIIDVDASANLVLILPALGNRSLVTVSINVSWNQGNGNDVESDALSDIKGFLSECGIHQR